MPKNTDLLKFIKFILATLGVFIIAYPGYSKIKSSNSNDKPINTYIAVTSVHTNPSLKDSIVDFAMGFLGTPYVEAGCGKDGFDCSGFVYFVFQHYKIKVPRSSSEFEHFGKEIPIKKLQKGDILLFLSPTRNVIGHVGIVSNPNGKESDFIHASSGRTMKVIISNLSGEGYKERFVKAIRVL